MKTISPRDASCLAIAAEHPKMPAEVAEKYLRLINDPEAKLIFQALMKDESEWAEYPESVIRSAKDLLAWAKQNRGMSPGRCCPECECSRSNRR